VPDERSEAVSEYPLYDDVKAADKVMGKEVAVRRQRRPMHPVDRENGGRVAAVERGVRYPNGNEVYERVEYSD
jgi:hypothetical protein